MKTDAEKQAEIAALERCKMYVPKKTFFGDDNHERIDVQIRVIREGLDEDDCAKGFLHGGEVDEDGDPVDNAYDLETHAVEASKWLFGDGDAPHKEWSTFDPKVKAKRQVAKSAALGAPYGKSKPIKGDPYKKLAKAITGPLAALYPKKTKKRK